MNSKAPERGNLLTLREVERRWGNRPVIQGANLSLRRGVVAWLGGANGAGKTTLLRMAAGLIAADEGEIDFMGLHPQRQRRAYQRGLGWLPAGNGGLYNRLSVRQNLGYAASIALLPRERRRPAVDTMVSRFGLESLVGNRADRISMGERQRVRLAMAFVHQPKLVLLDEPHTSLDEAGLARLSGALAALASDGGAAIWCAPGREDADLPSDEAYVVQEGRPTPC